MPELVFADPHGSPYETIELEHLIALLDHDEMYWNCDDEGGCGHASIFFYQNRRTSTASPDARIDCTYSNGDGFHLFLVVNHDDNTTTKRYAYQPDTTDAAVRLNYAGGVRVVPRHLFVSRDVAKQVLTKFSTDGNPLAVGTWVRHSDIDWIKYEIE